jgi:uncharacterized protein (DUF4213/DUF364 family)
MQVLALMQVKAMRRDRIHDGTKRGVIMPTVDIIIVSGTVVAFVAFALVLAWGDYQTRNLPERR